MIKGYIRETIIPCVIPVLLIPKKKMGPGRCVLIFMTSIILQKKTHSLF